jgi:uncharacterized membrane protein
VGISFEHPRALLVLLLPLAWWGWGAWRGRSLRLKPGLFGWVRLLLTLLLVLALAGTGITYSARHQAVMFVADISTSTASVRAEMDSFIRNGIGQMPPGDVAGVMAVAEDAQLEAPVGARPAFSGFTAVVRPEHTDLERGLRLGAALLPGGFRPRLVLLSDGQENVGNAMAEVQRLRQRGITVDVVNLSPAPGAEALIRSLEAPGALRLGERLDVAVTLSATAATKATLRIYEDQALLETRSLSLQAGDSQVRVSMEGLKPGYHRIWATLEAERDTLTQNNQAAAMVNMQGAPSILVVEGFPGTGTNIRRALEATGMAVEVRTPDMLPTHGTQFAQWASVVLVDVPAPLLRPATMDALSSYVKQGGHGLAAIGGENSYAMGGYGGTKLEELLPVTMDVPQRKEKPPVAVALIIENFESDAKINISKEAGKALVDMLTPRDYIIVGDATVVGNWVVPPQKVTDKAKIKGLIDAMAPGDPPHYMDHLEAAAAELDRLDAKVKHIVLAGDGDAQLILMRDYAARVAKIAEKGITVSTVHVNWQQPSEQVLMQLIAQMGRGRYYLATDPAATPQIFLKEAQTMARPGIIEEDFYPSVLSRSPVLQGISELPLLRGYVGTTPKPTGEVVLQSAQADPVLATWQAGLGKVAAFTSDAGGLWTEQMVRWPGFSQFWSNVVSWTMPAADASGIRTMASVVGGKAQLSVELPGEGLPPKITAGIIRPDGSTQVLPLRGMAPGHYEGEIPVAQPGPYLVKLSAGTRQESVLLGETFIVAPYSPEFAAAAGDPGFMQRVAEAGGGKVLTEPGAAFARDLPPAPGRLPLDQALLIAALLLWPLDIALRRLSVRPGEVREAIRRRRERRGGAPAPVTAAASALGKLRERRTEAVSRAPAAQPPSPSPAARAPAEPRAAQPPELGAPFTQRLLEARRKRKD